MSCTIVLSVSQSHGNCIFAMSVKAYSQAPGVVSLGLDYPCRAEKVQEGAASSREKEGGREQRVSNCVRPGETLGSVLESAKQAVSGAAPGSSLSHAMEELHGSIAQLSATDQFAAHMAIGSLLTTK